MTPVETGASTVQRACCEALNSEATKRGHESDSGLVHACVHGVTLTEWKQADFLRHVTGGAPRSSPAVRAPFVHSLPLTIRRYIHLSAQLRGLGGARSAAVAAAGRGR